ncbi:two-component system OmpR family response regulator [Arcanobacterium hippocoleae]|uniref:Two-component system OmpR family response regulator n=2 Tax=Arcanobacterium hippocoleae TaxID=149017 RepID=A0ABU1T3K9_9ACTO|nr:response regulator transcription factor [Arcanobacterium hippocoleae]MDR6939815.1 two-component system OmpR family response regulator [Arcanobacterium hippocoleae]
MDEKKALEAKILVVDDEPNIRELLSVSLKFAGFAVETAQNGQEALEIERKFGADLVVLDVMLPDMDGFTVLQQLREHEHTLPVLFLTAKDDVQDRIQGLTVGGDDYITKPFSLEEVVARIRAVLRRTQPATNEASIIRYLDLELNEDSYEVTRAGRQIDLSPTEFKLLRYLLENQERVVSKIQILDHVWDYAWNGEVSIVESYISYLRRKIDSPESLGITDPDEAAKLIPLIHTKRGIGYVLRANR